MEYEFEVALSFAGEDRPFAEKVAEGLRMAGVNVFYDNFYAADLWGEDLSTKLHHIYRGSSRHCIMILTQAYVEKMWTTWERQQAIERLIQQKGRAYILPVRLDGFQGDVPGLPGTISHLALRRDEADRVVDAYLSKIGKTTAKSPPPATSPPRGSRLRREFTDKDRNTFFGDAFEEIVRTMEGFGRAVHLEQPSFECELDRITSRKALLRLYRSGNELTKLKVWRGGTFGADTICFAYGRHLDVDNDSYNESLSLVEDAGELKLSLMGMMSFGSVQKVMSPPEAAEYLWEGATRHL